jgi:hypothetical protein
MAFKYTRRERTVEDIRRKASEGSRDYDNLFKGDAKLFKPGEGENIVRIMPPTWGSQPYDDVELAKMPEAELKKIAEEDDRFGIGWDLPIYVHYGVGPDNASYLCLDKMRGERCPICEAQAATRDPDEADALKPTKRGLCYIIDRNAEKEGPQLWSMPFQKIRNEIYARSVDKKKGTAIKVDDPEEGFDVSFNRAGKDDRTNYTSVEVDREPTTLADDERQQERWLDYIFDHPLQDALNFYDPEHIEKVLSGRASAKRDEEAEGGAEKVEERPGRAGRRSSLRDRARGSGAPEERDYMDPEADPSAEEAPRRSRRPAAPPVEEPDEEVDEALSGADDPPFEEDTPPRRGRTPRRPAAAPEPEADADASPTEQARSRLRGMRSRRGA